MSVGDYGRQAIQMGKQELKNWAKKTLLPIVLKYVVPVVVLILIIVSVLGGGGGVEVSAKEEEYLNMNGVICGNTTQEKIWFSLRNAGYSEIAVAGVMGNIYGESGFKPDAIESNGEGYGLCQWSFGRKTSLINYAKSKGKDWSDEDIQIEFLLAEINPSGGANGYATFQMGGTHYGYTYSSWKNATSVEEATKAFMAVFERPDMTLAHTETRVNAANEAYTTYKGKTWIVADNKDLYNADGSVNETKIQQLELQLEKSHNLVTSGNGYQWVSVTESDQRKATGKFHGSNGGGTYGKNGLEVYQCTWWAQGRASEYLSTYGTKYKQYPTNNGNGGDYYTKNKANGWFNYGSTPKPNSLLSTTGTSGYGHVLYIEAVDYVNKCYYASEAGGGYQWGGIHKYSFGHHPCTGNYGFIYLSEPK